MGFTRELLWACDEYCAATHSLWEVTTLFLKVDGTVAEEARCKVL